MFPAVRGRGVCRRSCFLNIVGEVMTHLLTYSLMYGGVSGDTDWSFYGGFTHPLVGLRPCSTTGSGPAGTRGGTGARARPRERNLMTPRRAGGTGLGRRVGFGERRLRRRPRRVGRAVQGRGSGLSVPERETRVGRLFLFLIRQSGSPSTGSFREGFNPGSRVPFQFRHRARTQLT